ncbi:MAG TPA: STAS/SEC14 domain-containing protein [Solirubrobacterales bacterium]|nr:STAS/SEC14 domain-containing protein [Solirubrobacterales bacterium]
MVERMGDMPDGVIGLRGSGKLTKEDYTDVLEPALKGAMDSGEGRVVFVLTDFDGLELGATFEDIKTGLGVELGNRKTWRRLALVTDVDWVARAMRMFAWAMPGELGVYESLDDLEKAKTWVAG